MNDRQLTDVTKALQGLKTQIQSMKKELEDLKEAQGTTLRQSKENYALIAKSLGMSKTQAAQAVTQWWSSIF